MFAAITRIAEMHTAITHMAWAIVGAWLTACGGIAAVVAEHERARVDGSPAFLRWISRVLACSGIAVIAFTSSWMQALSICLPISFSVYVLVAQRTQLFFVETPGWPAPREEKATARWDFGGL
jgi:hypothetical protein